MTISFEEVDLRIAQSSMPCSYKTGKPMVFEEIRSEVTSDRYRVNKQTGEISCKFEKSQTYVPVMQDFNLLSLPYHK